MPKLTRKLDTVIGLLEGVQESLKVYEKAEYKNPGYGEITKTESKESIQRRILVAREELLKLSKEI